MTTKTKTKTKPEAKQSKTDAIRNALKSVKGGSPSAVAERLGKAGIKVTPQYVSTIKANDKRKAEAGGPLRRPGRPPKKQQESSVSLKPCAELASATKLMGQVIDLVLATGANQAKELIDSAEEMIAKAKKGAT